MKVESLNRTSTFTCEVDQIAPHEWDELLDDFTDANIYQTWSYGEERWGRKNLSHLVLKRDECVVAAGQLRIVCPLSLPFGIAYMRWGPLWERRGGEAEQETLLAMAEAFRAEYVVRRGLFLRILPAGVQGTPRAAAFNEAFRQYQIEPFSPGDSYRTFLLDIRPPLDVIRRQLDQKWRNQLNRAEKNPLQVKEGETEKDLDLVVSLFDQMHARKRFARSSDIRQFCRIQNSLSPRQRMRAFTCYEDGQPVAGTIASCIGETGIYLFGGTSDAGLKSKGSYLLQWRMIQWFKECGATSYNLGGINPVTNPGVYHFKKGLSGADVLYLEPRVLCRNPISRAAVSVGKLIRASISKKRKGSVAPVLVESASERKGE